MWGEVDKIANGNNYERGERGRSIFVSEFVNNKLLNFLFFVNGRLITQPNIGKKMQKIWRELEGRRKRLNQIIS